MGPKMISHQNRFYGVFWKRGMRSTSCFLSHQKILILAKVIVGQRSASMSNSIVQAIFMWVFSKTKLSIFKIYLLHFFKRSSWNFWRICSRVNLEMNCPTKCWFRPLNQNYLILNISEHQKLMRNQVQNIQNSISLV